MKASVEIPVNIGIAPVVELHAEPEVNLDHLWVIIDSNPMIPNRTEALLSGETGPVIEAL